MSDAQETYFRMCWMTLKSEASGKLRKQMDDIEIKLCGLTKMKLLEKKNGSSPKYKQIV